MAPSINWTRYANGDDEVAKGIDGVDGDSIFVESEGPPRMTVADLCVGPSIGEAPPLVHVIDSRGAYTPLEARRLAAALLACADVAEGKEVG